MNDFKEAIGRAQNAYNSAQTLRILKDSFFTYPKELSGSSKYADPEVIINGGANYKGRFMAITEAKAWRDRIAKFYKGDFVVTARYEGSLAAIHRFNVQEDEE